MANSGMVTPDTAEAYGSARVLAFSVDDALFSIHLDWAQAVHPAESTAVHSVKDKRGGSHRFLVDRGEPAFVVDLREVFGLGEILGATQRAAYVVVRCGSYRLALQVDSIEGIRYLELDAPVPSMLVRDGGVCVANLVEHEGGILIVLDPNRLLDGAMRDALEPAVRAARALIAREEKIQQLWAEIRRSGDVNEVRAYARLCRRNGRSKSAAAARTLLKFLEGSAAAPESAAERIICELVRLCADEVDGALVCELREGGSGRVFLAGGRIVGAELEPDYGLRALRRLLDLREVHCQFVDDPAGAHSQQMNDSSAAVLISALESSTDGRRARRER